MSHHRYYKLPTLAQAERALGEPARKWAARCYEIASRIVEAKLCPPGSAAVYGHWLGPVAPGSHFDRGIRLPFVRHGWVLLPDGRVLDPTRWAFENVEPYLYTGPNDHYDEGGSQWHNSRQGTAPSFDPNAHAFDLDIDLHTKTFLKTLLPSTLTNLSGQLVVDIHQLMWLANTDPRKLGVHAPTIFRAICTAGQRALIPIDNLRRVERENSATPGARRRSTT